MNQSLNKFSSTIKKYCLFVSPHFDDVLLSCGTTLKKLMQAGHKIDVVNVFTKPATWPYSPGALWLMKKSGFDNAKTYFLARKREDSEVLNKLNVRVSNFDFVEALFRKRGIFKHKLPALLGSIFPSIAYLYPRTSDLFEKENSENNLKGLIKNALVRKIKRDYQQKEVTVFLPLAIGDHIDHIIIKNALSDILENTIYWEDVPYCLDKDSRNKFFREKANYKLLFSQKADSGKKELVRTYKTQFYSLFPNNNLPSHAERFWIKEFK